MAIGGPLVTLILSRYWEGVYLMILADLNNSLYPFRKNIKKYLSKTFFL
jgi:hypothetical protein